MLVEELIYKLVFGADTDDLDEVDNKLEQIEDQVGDIAKAFAIVGGAITGFAALAIREFLPVEQKFAQLEGLVGLTQERIEELKPTLSDIATDTATSLEKIANAYFFIESAGVRGAGAIDLTTASAKAQAIGLGEAAQIAEFGASALNVYGEENLSAAGAVNTLAAGIKEGVLEARSLIQPLLNTIPVAQLLNIGLGQLTGTMSAMSRRGVNAARSQTQLLEIFNAVLKPTTESEKALDSVGLSMERLREVIREDGLVAALELVLDALDGNRDRLSEVFTSATALRGALVLLGGDLEETKDVIRAVSEDTGRLDEAFGIMEDTTGFRLRQAWVSMRTAMVAFGDAISPLIESVSGVVLPVLTGLVSLLTSGSPVVRFLSQSVAVLGVSLLALSGILFAVKIVLGSLSGLMIAWRLAVLAATAAQWLWNVALTANPIGLIIVGIGAMIAAVALLITHWDKVVDVLKTVWDWFSRILSFTPFGLIGQVVSAGTGAIEAGVGIPRFQDGGIVQGPIGAPQLAIVHGGELVTPAPQVSRHTETMRPTIIDNSRTLNFNGTINSSAQNFDELIEDIEKRMGRNNRLATRGKVSEIDT